MASSFVLLDEIRALVKGNLEKNQSRSTAIFAYAIESLLAGVESTVDIVEISHDYTVTSRNSAILVDASADDVIITLPPAEEFLNYTAGTTKVLYIKRIDGSANSVTVLPHSSNAIETASDYVMASPLQSVILGPDGNDWYVLATNGGGGGGGSGDVVGPASSTPTAVARFNGSTGKLLANSAVTIDNAGNIATPGTVDGRDLSVDGAKLDGIAPAATNTPLTTATPIAVQKNTAVVGVSTEAARADHRHDVQTAAPSSVGSANTEGTSTSLARADHVHAHGDQAGGSLHATAVANTSAGFISGADQAKLNGIESGAQVNTVTSVFGRTGAVTASSGDYTSGQVTNTSTVSGTDVTDALNTLDSSKVEIGGQLGNTVTSPDVRGIRETAGPTLLAIGAIADGEYLRRSGSTVVGDTPPGGGGAVDSVFGRTGTVVAQSGDYTLDLIPVLTTGSPTTVEDAADAYRHMWSAGSVSGFGLTNNGDGTITVAAGEGMLRIAAASVAQLRSVSCAGGSPVLTNNATNYVYFEWNGGSPQLGVTTSVTGFNCQDACLLYTISREGNILSIFDARNMNVDSNRKHRRQLFETERLRRVQGGTTLGNAGTRRITVTAGAFYYALNRLDHPAFDTTIAGTALTNVFTYRYRDGVGGWSSINDQKQINNTQYDNGTGTLATLGNNRYRADWVYLIPGTNARLIVVLGQVESSNLAAAKVVSPPTSLPPLVSSAGVLIGRVIIEQGATEIASVASTFDTTFSPTLVVAHADLSGLQGGDVGERYHLTLAQHTDAVAMSVVGNDRIVYRDSSGDIVGLVPLTLTSTPPVNVTKAAAVVGVSTEAARADHKHDITTAAPVTIGSANAEGSSTSLARADHVHSHGDQAGGSLHAAATTTVDGFMSGADKLKLDGIASGAQVNTVTSVFGRTGAVTADSGDYDADQVTFDPSGLFNITGTDVQAAIASIDSQLGGGGGAPSIVVVEGYDTSNSYQTAINQLPGSTSFTAIWYGYLLGLLHGAPQFLMGNHNMSGHGWAIVAGARNLGSASYLQFEVFDGTGFAGVTSEILEAHDYFMYCMRPLHLAIRYDGGSVRGFINGQATRFDGTGTGFTAASGARFMVGNNPSVWNEPATRAGFAGAGYISSGLTETQIQDHFQACRESNNRFVAGAVSWEHRYDVLAPGGSFPTQIDDLVASAHLERVGTAITGTTTRRVV